MSAELSKVGVKNADASPFCESVQGIAGQDFMDAISAVRAADALPMRIGANEFQGARSVAELDGLHEAVARVKAIFCGSESG